MATKFGKELRKIRIDHDDNLVGMAGKLGVSVSYVSGVEAGGKSIPPTWPEILVSAYSLTSDESSRLVEAYEECAKTIKVDLLNATAMQRKVSSMFFRRLPNMTDEECKEMFKALDGKSKK